MSLDIMLKKVCKQRTGSYLNIRGIKYPKWIEKFIQDIKESYFDFKSYFEGKNLKLKDWVRRGTAYGENPLTVFKNKNTGETIDVFLKDVPRKIRTIRGFYYVEIGFINGWIDNEEDFIWTKEKLSEIKETYCGCNDINYFVDKFVDGETFVMIL